MVDPQELLEHRNGKWTLTQELWTSGPPLHPGKSWHWEEKWPWSLSNKAKPRQICFTILQMAQWIFIGACSYCFKSMVFKVIHHLSFWLCENKCRGGKHLSTFAQCPSTVLKYNLPVVLSSFHSDVADNEVNHGSTESASQTLSMLTNRFGNESVQTYGTLVSTPV